MSYLSEIDLVTLKQEYSDSSNGKFQIEPLLPGFGTTLGNTLRRILLSSLKGAAITAIKINDVTHEFATLGGVTEDVVSIILNLKGVRILYESDEPVNIHLDVKGQKIVTAGDFKCPAGVEIINKEQIIAHVDKGANISIQAVVERGKGYLPTESRKDDSLPTGMIAIDAIFTPIKKINFEVGNTRVGKATDFDKLSIDITTDGSISAANAFKVATEILSQYINAISENIMESDKKVVKLKKNKVNKGK